MGRSPRFRANDMSNPHPAQPNTHFLAHMAAASEVHEMSVTEDILAANGMKLVAKGSRIDAGVCDRLLRHVLRKPLEDCVQVADGVAASELEPLGEALLQRHPLLAALVVDPRARAAPASLAALKLTPAILSLLTVYVSAGKQRLEHVTGVAMLALALARKLFPGDLQRHRVLAVAGLLHDVGELYIDPAFLQRGTPLAEEQWRHIVTHPLVAGHVLRDLDGAGPAVADAVLLHHERLDGFGYPQGLGGAAFALDGQILAAAEWLMALIEHEASPLTHARMATRLVPGEFNQALLDLVAGAALEAPDSPVQLAAVPPLEDAVPRIERLGRVLSRFRALRAEVEAAQAQAGPALRSVLQAGQQRMSRIHATFTSAGLDAGQPAALVAELAALRDPAAYMEVMALVGELEWRLREFERKQRLRCLMLEPADRAIAEGAMACVSPEPVPESEALA